MSFSRCTTTCVWDVLHRAERVHCSWWFRWDKETSIVWDNMGANCMQNTRKERRGMGLFMVSILDGTILQSCFGPHVEIKTLFIRHCWKVLKFWVTLPKMERFTARSSSWSNKPAACARRRTGINWWTTGNKGELLWLIQAILGPPQGFPVHLSRDHSTLNNSLYLFVSGAKCSTFLHRDIDLDWLSLVTVLKLKY